MANQRKAKSIRGYFSLTIILFLVGLILFVVCAFISYFLIRFTNKNTSLEK